LGLPARTWWNFENGVTIPGDILLRFLQHTNADAHWLLTGEGDKYRSRQASQSPWSISARAGQVRSDRSLQEPRAGNFPNLRSTGKM